MDLGKIFFNMIVSFFNSAMESILGGTVAEDVNNVFDSMATNITDMFISSNAISNLFFVDRIYATMRVIGIAVLILVASWQTFKAFFAWAGFEADEPLKIAVRTIVMGLLIWYGKDLMYYLVDITSQFVHMALMTVMSGNAQTDLNAVFIGLIGNVGLGGGLMGILSFYIFIKAIGLFLKMFERMILCALLVVASPLAFAAGASQPTKGFLTGFIRVFTGSLLTQFMQMVCLTAVVLLYMGTDLFDPGLMTFFYTYGIFKICGKLEEIIRDMSINVGVGRDMGNALNKMQSTFMTGSSAMSVIKGFGK